MNLTHNVLMILDDAETFVPDSLSDEELLSASRGDGEQFAILLRRYEAAFLRRARAIVRNEKDAEDIVQETFLKIYLHAEKFHNVPGATFRSWAYRILMNTAFTRYGRLKRKGALQVDLEPEVYEFLADDRDERRVNEFADLAKNLLSRIPESFARPLRLFFLEEYSQKEIADMEGLTVAAVKTRIYRGKQALEEIARLDGEII